MSYLGEQLFNGLMLGCVYALIAIGFSMIYGVVRLMNFAHGELFMAGSFTGMFTAAAPWWRLHASPAWTLAAGLLVAVGASAVAGAVLGVALELVAYRKVRRTSRMATFLVAVGASIFLQYLAFRLFTASPRGFGAVPALVSAAERGRILSGGALGLSGELLAASAAPLPAAVSVLGLAPVPWLRNLITLGTLALAIGIAIWFVYRTDTGLAVRAVSLDEPAARTLGIRATRAVVWTFSVGGALAGIAGFVWGLRYGGIQPLMGFIPGIKAFVAAVVGGFGSLPGALLGGLLLGFIETLSFAYLPGEISGFRDALTLLILLSFLLVRPNGMLGATLGDRA
jgi:branched-chain amino acid transport system permease protein